MDNMENKENSSCDINKGQDNATCGCGCKTKKCSCGKKVLCLLVLVLIVGAIIYAKMNCCSSSCPVIESESISIEATK
ncbi:MAG: hypothetical protein R3Y46_06790 [Opitutales bacterium]